MCNIRNHEGIATSSKELDNLMYAIHIASELAPIAKVGGLGDVLLGLCRELSWKGLDIDIIIPKYDCIDSTDIRDLNIDYPDLMTFYDGAWFHNTVWVGWVENLKVYFIEPHHPMHFFERGCFYGCEDDMDRYLYFCRASLEFIFKKQLRPDIIHLHDWQTAVVGVLYRDIYEHLGWTNSKIVFTFHNLEYQGKCSTHNLDKIGLQGLQYLVQNKMQDPMSPALINLMKGAFLYSDFITTVSPNYAKEVVTPLGGRGLDGELNKFKDKFQGVLNGLDYSYWNPEVDRFLPAHFSPREHPSNKKDRNTLDRKGFIKKVLRQRLMLSEQHKPIVSCIARLVPQKGIDLIKHTLKYCLEHNGQFILLGSSPIPSISNEFHALKNQYHDDSNVHLALINEEDLAHLIYAGSDMFIVPSLFEPCGLTQIISLKYGTIPVVRRTGGLADTIFDVDYSGKPFEETNGYVFDYPDPRGIESALDRAFECYFHDPDKWRRLMIQGMNIDYSWDKPSNQYLQIYNNLLGKK